ncbi:MAG: DUF3761 domain-containing protein [Acidobacteria bacterium]|nr:DUF3761 domain-containing protein [Acidobacteriota bacterium]
MRHLIKIRAQSMAFVLFLVLIVGCLAPSTLSFHGAANGNSNSNPPAGATARCNDGTYSYSQHRRGTCSHHGGVAEWLRSDIPN